MFKVFISNKKNKVKDHITNFKKKSIRIIKMNQTHSSNISKITNLNSEKTITIHNTDAIYTNISNSVLVVKFADCMPLIIYHPKKVICTIHAGRKGTMNQIVKKTIQALVSETKTKKNFKIIIGPHLCEKCHEINKEKKEHFNLLKENLNQIKSILNLKENKLHINLECTKCGNNFYSYRGENKTKKRNYLFCQLS